MDDVDRPLFFPLTVALRHPERAREATSCCMQVIPNYDSAMLYLGGGIDQFGPTARPICKYTCALVRDDPVDS